MKKPTACAIKLTGRAVKVRPDTTRQLPRVGKDGAGETGYEGAVTAYREGRGRKVRHEAAIAVCWGRVGKGRPEIRGRSLCMVENGRGEAGDEGQLRYVENGRR